MSSLTELRSQTRARVRVSYIKEVCYAPFDQDHIRLLCKLINHNWECDFSACETFSDKAELLRKPVPERCHVAVGALETLERTASGLRFIPYPGLEQHLNGVTSAAAPADLTWGDIVNGKRKFTVLTISDEVGDQYVRGVGNYPATAIISVPRYNLAELNDAFVNLLNKQPAGKVVLVAAEHVCYEILRRNRQRTRALVQPDASPEDLRALPNYKPGLLVHYEDEEWYELLKKAQEFAMQSAQESMVQLYAKHLVNLISLDPADHPANHGLSFARLHSLGSNYPRELRGDFLNRLKIVLGEQLSDGFAPEAEQKAIVDYALALAKRRSVDAPKEHAGVRNEIRRLRAVARDQKLVLERIQAQLAQLVPVEPAGSRSR